MHELYIFFYAFLAGVLLFIIKGLISYKPKLDLTRFRWPLIRRIYPQLIANKIVAVQPLSEPSSLKYYINYRYSSNKQPKFKMITEWKKFGVYEFENGDKKYLQDGKKHHDHGPAVIRKNVKEWWAHGEWAKTEHYNNEGLKHNARGPAVVCASGREEWWVDGRLHRIGGPAKRKADGTLYWYLDGKIHRDGPPAIIRSNGEVQYFTNGKLLKTFQYDENQKLHSIDGKPAIETEDGYKAWYKHGELHREGWPAVIHQDGTQEWWLYGEQRND